MSSLQLQVVGRVASTLTDRASAPRQADEGAPGAWLVFDERFAPALAGVSADSDAVLLTWLDRADRETQSVHPRGDPHRPVTGVFATRSPDRPNPIGLHEVHIDAVDGARLHVSALEAIDGTPILDLKPVLTAQR